MIVAWAYDLLPPRVSGQYPNQRWFECPSGRVAGGDVEVYRNGETNKAELRFTSVTGSVHITVGAPLNAEQLREVAALALRAAHDLDANPAPAQLNDIAPCDRDERDPEPDHYVYPIHPAVLQEG